MGALLDAMEPGDGRKQIEMRYATFVTHRDDPMGFWSSSGLGRLAGITDIRLAACEEAILALETRDRLLCI